MKNLVQNFTNQLKEAIDISEKAVLSKKKNIHNIVISGLGGSGIGGTIVSELIYDSCTVPVTIVKDYFSPAFVSQNTLLIASSYSGNTEETLQAVEQAIGKGAQVVCVTSGGKILEMAKQHQFDFIQIPSGNPPRACLGYSLIQLIKILVHNDFLSLNIFTQLKDTIHLLEEENENIKTQAHEIAKKLVNKIPVIYSLGTCEGVAVRFRQQINENSKMLCWHHTLPEMNHNELVGWTTRSENLAVVTFHTSFDYARTKKRYEFCKPIFEKLSSVVIDIEAKGESKIEQFLYLINIGDWISCYIADLREIDAVEVKVIDGLKVTLAKF